MCSFPLVLLTFTYSDVQSSSKIGFFRDVVYVIYIPKNYQEKRLNQEDITLKIKSTNTYEGALSEEILKRYLESEKVYTKNYNNINTIISKNIVTIILDINILKCDKSLILDNTSPEVFP